MTSASRTLTRYRPSPCSDAITRSSVVTLRFHAVRRLTPTKLAQMSREIATFEDVYSRPPTEGERGRITSCGFEIACVDRVNGYHCPIVDCNGTYDGGMVYDVCRVCGGDNSSCLGCDGVPVAVSRRLLRLV